MEQIFKQITIPIEDRFRVLPYPGRAHFVDMELKPMRYTRENFLQYDSENSSLAAIFDFIRIFEVESLKK